MIYSIAEEFWFFKNISFRNNISPIILGSFSDLFSLMLGKSPDSSGVNSCYQTGRGYRVTHMEQDMLMDFKVK